MRRSFYERENWIGSTERIEISESEAAKRHPARKPYGVLLPDEQAEVEFYFSATYCNVRFLSGPDRVELIYSFEERDGKLFLFQATYFGLAHPSRRAMDVYVFRADGRVRIRKTDDQGETVVGENKVDVAANWAPLPPFGGLGDLLMRERR